MAVDPVTAGLDLVNTAVTRIWPDATELQKHRMMLETQTILGQLKVNAQEARHRSIFVAGWRPFIGWTCGIGIAYEVGLRPLLTWLCENIGWTAPPHINEAILIPIVTAMLGIGTMRTVERLRGVERRTMDDAPNVVVHDPAPLPQLPAPTLPPLPQRDLSEPSVALPSSQANQQLDKYIN